VGNPASFNAPPTVGMPPLFITLYIPPAAFIADAPLKLVPAAIFVVLNAACSGYFALPIMFDIVSGSIVLRAVFV
jgi:hypothetical protein